MTTTSRVPVVLDALFSTLTTALPAAKVFDGPYVTVPDGDFLTIGWTPTGVLVTAAQSWAGLGNKARDEQIDVPCYCLSFSGTTTTKARRDASFALLAAVENSLRADPTLGGVIPNPGWAYLDNVEALTEQTSSGVAVGVVFHIAVKTRI